MGNASEPPILIEHREQLWGLLGQAGQLEHMIMCQYLFAAASLKESVDEGVGAEQLEAITRWKRLINEIASQEMLHLALVCNLISAIGGAPDFNRPNFPSRSGWFPPSVQLDLLPFGESALTHFLYLERPEGMERVDAHDFKPMAPPPQPVEPAELFPRQQEFHTVGHLYRGIADGLKKLSDRLGERRLFVGPPAAQATTELFHLPELTPVTDLGSALAALYRIIEQGEGARGDWKTAHYGRFLGMWNEWADFARQDPNFQPARPVMRAFTRQPYDVAEAQPVLSDTKTVKVAELFNLGYELTLHMLVRFYTHTDETPDQLGIVAGTAIGLMTGVLRPLGVALSKLPAGREHKGRTAGPGFEMYYPMGNVLPSVKAAWTIVHERQSILADRCSEVAQIEGLPREVAMASRQAQRLAARLEPHVPA